MSLTSAKEAETLAAQLEDDTGVATAVVLQANVLYHKGQMAAAKSMAEKGFRLAEDAGAADLAAEAADLIAQAAEAMPAAAAAAAVTVAAVEDSGPKPAVDAGAASGAVVEAKAGLDPAEVSDKIMKVAVSSVAGDEDIELDTPLMDAGLDSLASVAFRNSLQNELSMQMPASLMFDYPNIRQITDYIVEKSMS